MDGHLTSFYLKQPEPNRSCLLVLRDILLSHNEPLTETIKYGMPCFCYGKKAVCYLWKDKKTDEPYVLFVDGNLLSHNKLEAGDRKRMKVLRIAPDKDIPVSTINAIVTDAVAIHRH